MKKFLTYLIENKRMLNEGGASGHMSHLFETGELSFGQLRQIFKDLFSGKLEVEEKTDGQALAVTYKDGEVKAARNKTTLKDPLTMEQLKKMFEGRGEIKDAFVNSMDDITKALESLDKVELEDIFNDGQNFMAFEIIYPPTKNVIDYGDRCMIKLHGINIYDEHFNKISEDKAAAQKLFNYLQEHDALKQKTFEISGNAKLKIKNSTEAAEALKQVLDDLDKLVDGIGYKSTINDYVNEHYQKKIVNAAMKSGIDISKDSDFVKELSARLSYVSGRRPTKADLITFAKREKIDVKSPEYKEFLSRMESTLDEDNQEIILPIENLVVKAGTLLIQNLSGFVAADRTKSAQKLSSELDACIDNLKQNEEGLTDGKRKTMVKNLKKLEEFGKTPTGVEGIVFVYKGRVFKMTGNFGAINQLLGILKF